MGGKKKLSLKQMERMQEKKDAEEKEKKKEKVGVSKEKKLPAVIPPDAKSDKVIGELKKMHVLTPYSVATHFNMRISAAKELLDQLNENGAIQLVSGNHNIKIYRVD
jgi:small subunit ribosomal protein S25e